MSRSSLRLVIAIAIISITSSIVAAQTTSFTYQGKLNDGGSPANGVYDLQFTLYDTGGTQVGSTLTQNGVTVTNGIFAVDLDFGAAAFPGADRFLEIGVRKPPQSTFTTLTPKQQIKTTPYAIHALSVDTTGGDSVINAINDNSTTTTISDSRLPNNIVRLLPASPPQIPTGVTDPGDSIISVAHPFVTFPYSYTYKNDGGVQFTGTMDDGTFPHSGTLPSGPGVRMMWHPKRAAFRAGSLNQNSTGIDDGFGLIFSSGTQWDEDNIGYSSVAMGENNRASGNAATAFGRNAQAVQDTSFAWGDYAIASGKTSIALGHGAHTNAREGSFVFADRSSDEVFRSGVKWSAQWRVANGFRIFTSSNLSTGVTIQSGVLTSNWGQSNAVISTSTGAYLSTSGIWTNNSSRAAKANFSPVNSRAVLHSVLDLPITTWNYKIDDTKIRHIGPMAQDFYERFKVGSDDEHVNSVDESGVAFAAIQGLYQEIKDRDAKNAALQRQIDQLNTRLNALERAAKPHHRVHRHR